MYLLQISGTWIILAINYTVATNSEFMVGDKKKIEFDS